MFVVISVNDFDGCSHAACSSYSFLYSSGPLDGGTTPDETATWSGFISRGSAATLMRYKMGAECGLQEKEEV